MVSGFPVTVTVAGTALDPGSVALPLTITHGRSGIGTQPDAPECSFVWVGSTPPGQLGDTVTVWSAEAPHADWGDPGVTWGDPVWTWLGGQPGPAGVRFAGRITSLVAREALGSVQEWQVQATGDMARLGFLPVLLDRPQETDTARVAAIAAAAGVTINVKGSAGITLVADLIDRDALGALHEVCASSGGLLWQDRAGVLWYGTLNHREIDPEGVLPAGAILDGIDWNNDLELLANLVVLRWGPEGSQTQDTFRDDTSIAQWGTFGVDVTTLAADRTQAGVLGQLILARRSQPYWRMPGVLFRYGDGSPADSETVAALEVSDAVLVPVTTTPGPTPATLTPWLVEGWVEQWDESGHTAQLALSDAARSTTAGIRTWQEQRDAGTWDTWRQGSWLEQVVEVAP